MILFYDRSNNNNRNFFFEESLKNSEVNVTFNKAVISGKLWLNWHMTHIHDSYAWSMQHGAYGIIHTSMHLKSAVLICKNH